MKNIDIWDFKLIWQFKNASIKNPTTLDSIKGIWTERCYIDINYVNIENINNHLIKLAHELGLFDNYLILEDFIKKLDSKYNEHHVCLSNEYLNLKTTDYQTILLSRFDSLFGCANVSELPGYKEFLTNPLNNENPENNLTV